MLTGKCGLLALSERLRSYRGDGNRLRRVRSALGGFLGNVIMSIMNYEGKCGLPVLCYRVPRQQHRLVPAGMRTGRVSYQGSAPAAP